MTAGDLLAGGMKLIAAASPFILIQFSIVYADKIIDLLRKSVLGRRRGGF